MTAEATSQLAQAAASLDRGLEGLSWTPVAHASSGTSGLPYAVAAATLNVGGATLRCYQLNTGERVFDASDVEAFFAGALGEPAAIPPGSRWDESATGRRLPCCLDSEKRPIAPTRPP